MNSKPNFLDSDPSIIEKNLKFVKNEFEEELEQIFGNTETGGSSSVDYKIVTPEPGMCIKCFKVNTNEKFFINLCQTNGLLPPEDITENELHEILISVKPSTYRIPMSITEPRITKDKSGKNVDVCDIAINPDFFKKCEKFIIFRDFLIAIILETLSEKYNVQLSDNWIILKNRKLIGTLVQHRIQNRNNQRVYDSYKNPSIEHKKILKNCIGDDKMVSEKNLIQEITKEETKKILKQKEDKIDKLSIKEPELLIPEYRIYGKTKNSQINEIICEFYLPECISAKEITLDVGEDRIVLESFERGYYFDKFIEYRIDRDKVNANFNLVTKMLEIQMPLLNSFDNKN